MNYDKLNLIRKFWVLLLLALPGLTYIVNIELTMQLPSSAVLSLAGISFALSTISLRRSWNEIETKLLQVALGGSCLVVFLLFWNFIFLEYAEFSNYSGDVFRGVFLKSRYAPIYPLSLSNAWKQHFYGWHAQTKGVYILILFVSIFILRIISWSDDWIQDRRFRIELLGWFAGLVLLFPLTNAPIRLTDFFAGYDKFYRSSLYFNEIGEILRNYLQKQPNLYGRTAHYPPGNLLLLKFGFHVLGIHWFAHAIVFLLTFLTLIPLNGIASELHVSDYTKNVAMALFISAPIVLIIPSLDLTPIPMFLTTTAIWLTLRAVRHKSLFLAVTPWRSPAQFLFLFRWDQVPPCQILMAKARLDVLLKNACIAILTFLLLYLIVYLFTGFNIYECLLQGIEHNQKSMGTNGRDSIVRYLFRSSGNLLAWLWGIGFPAAVSGIFAGWKALRFPQKERDSKTTAFTASVIIAIFLAGFSTLFFFETERIWLFFVPPWIILSAIALSNPVSKKNRGTLLKSLLVFSILMAVALELFFMPHWSFYFVPNWLHGR
jgi:hypothetical protein